MRLPRRGTTENFIVTAPDMPIGCLSQSGIFNKLIGAMCYKLKVVMTARAAELRRRRWKLNNNKSKMKQNKLHIKQLVLYSLLLAALSHWHRVISCYLIRTKN